jgi:hypothetical protein
VRQATRVDDGFCGIRNIHIVLLFSRAAYARSGVAALKADQRASIIPSDLDATQLFLSFQALAAHPFAFTQMTRFITGRNASDPAFQRERIKFLKVWAPRCSPNSTQLRSGRQPQARLTIACIRADMRVIAKSHVWRPQATLSTFTGSRSASDLASLARRCSC